METLSDESWDVVIAGTSIPQSLLALSLSRSGKKVLHIDRHRYYGGNDAGLTLKDAEDWVQELESSSSTVFKKASVSRPDRNDEGESAVKLGTSRSYTLSLNPQIIYAQSDFLPKIVSSRIHTQLEFLAVGSWWVHRDGALHKIPSTREDVFNDASFSMKDKRALMKFLRYVLQEDEESPLDQQEARMSLQEALDTKFKVPKSLHTALLALALSPVATDSIPFDKAVARIRRHMRSMGHFGAGFGAVIAKYGSTSEISQVACRAGAVGGGVYLLGHELKMLDWMKENSMSTNDAAGDNIPLFEGALSDGTRIKTRFVAGTIDDIPPMQGVSLDELPSTGTWRSINVAANPLKALFPQTSDNGPVPAAAIVLVETGTEDSGGSPIYLQIHSEDTGECPPGQCIIYASVTADGETAKDRLDAAVHGFLETVGAKDSLLWSLSYLNLGPADEPALTYPGLSKHSQVLVFPPEPNDISFPDGILAAVREAWKTILGPSASDESFLRFEEGEAEVE